MRSFLVVQQIQMNGGCKELWCDGPQTEELCECVFLLLATCAIHGAT